MLSQKRWMISWIQRPCERFEYFWPYQKDTNGQQCNSFNSELLQQYLFIINIFEILVSCWELKWLSVLACHLMVLCWLIAMTCFLLLLEKSVGQLKVLNSIPVCSCVCVCGCVRVCVKVPFIATVVYVQVNPATIAVISVYCLSSCCTWLGNREWNLLCVYVCTCARASQLSLCEGAVVVWMTVYFFASVLN